MISKIILLSISCIMVFQVLVPGLPMAGTLSTNITSDRTKETLFSPAPAAGGTLNNFNSGYDKGLPQNKRYSRDFSFLAVGDIDGDNDPDLAFGGGDYSPGETEGVYVYKGDGKGNWTSASSGLPTYDGWGGLAFGDADGDGKIELYAGDEGWGATAGTIDGIGAWEYSSGSWSTSGITSPVTSGHFNNLVLKNFTKGSGLDMAVAHSNKDTYGIKVYYSNGASPISWTSYSSGLPTSGEYTGLAVEDINNDGLPDIAGVSYGSTGLKIFTQKSDGTGWTDRTSSLPSAATSGSMMGVAMADLDQDGNTDIIYCTKDSGMKILLGNGGGSTGGTSFTWTTPTGGFPSNFGTSGRFSQIQLADIDQDGDLDLLAPKAGSGLYLFLGNGTNKPGKGFGWSQVTNKGLPTNMTIYGSAFFDLDGDKDLDLAAATWGDGVKVYQTSLTTTSVNYPPVPKAGNDRSIKLGKSVTLDGTASTDQEDAPSGDTNGNILTYEWNVTQYPSGSAIRDSSLSTSDKVAKPSFLPDKEGTYTLTLAVKDTKGKWSNKGNEDPVQVTVTNDPPVPKAGPDQSAHIGKTIYLNGTASTDQEDAPSGDANGNILTYEWNVTQYPSGSLIRDTSLSTSDKVAKPSFLPDKEGIYTLTLAVKDTKGKWSVKSNEDSVQVTISNDMPVPNAGPDQTIHIGKNVQLDGTSSTDYEDAPTGDKNGNILTYEWNVTQYPSGSLIRDTSLSTSDKVAKPSFLPDKEGIYTLTLAVKDTKGKWSKKGSEDNIQIKVLNDPPLPKAGMDQTYHIGKNILLNGTASSDNEDAPNGDKNGNTLVYDWNITLTPKGSLKKDSSLYLSDNIAKPSFYPDKEGYYIINLSVKDTKGKCSNRAHEDSVKVTVINDPPIPKAGQDIIIYLGERVDLNGTGSSDFEDAPSGDTGGTILFYDWNMTKFPPGSMNRDNSLKGSDKIARPYFYPDKVGKYIITLAVNDIFYKWSNRALESQVNISVLKPNDPPVADAGVDFSRYKETRISLNGSKSYDMDGSIVHWNWTCVSHSIIMVNGDSPFPSFIPYLSEIYSFSLKVQDDNGTWSRNEDHLNITIIELGENLRPSADAGKDQSNVIGQVVILDGSGSMDMDGEIITWLWNCSSHTRINMNNSNSSNPSFYPPGPGKYIFSLKVMDNNRSWSPEDIVIITIFEPYVNKKPVAIAGDDITIMEREWVTLDGSYSYDLDGLIITYIWDCPNSTFKMMGSNSSKPYFFADRPGSFIFYLTVMDDMGSWSNVDLMNVTIEEIYVPPPPPQPQIINVTPFIGRFLYESGRPMVGAQVVLVLIQPGANAPLVDFSVNTDEWGYAFFHQGIPPGNYSCTINIDGKVVNGPFQLEVLRDGSVIYEVEIPKINDITPPQDDDEEEPPQNDDDDDPPQVDDDEEPPLDDDDDPPQDDDDEILIPHGTPDDSSNSNSVTVILAITLVSLIIIGLCSLYFMFFHKKKDDNGSEDGLNDLRTVPINKSIKNIK